MIDDSTKPRRADVFPEEAAVEENTGPGCLVWAIVGVFGILLAIAIVLAAAFAGFNSGHSTARTTATAVRNQNIATQCAILPTDIAAGRSSIIQSRFENLAVEGVLPNCAQVYVPQATIIYEQSIITPTAEPSQTPTATATLPTTAPEATAASTELIVATSASSASGFDLTALLAEAQAYLADGNYEEGIRTLDAIVAIDPSFQTQTVNGLLFNALTQRATLLFRSEGGSLAEAVLLTQRAAEYGDVGELNFESSVAQLYLDAQAYLNVNYPNAIRALSQVITLSPNYPRGTGQAAQQLFSQYVAYGDAFAVSEPCRAVPQYDAALQLRSNAPEVTSKRDAAIQACSIGVPATLDPNATIDPNAAPTATQQGIAPIGQQG